MKEAVVTAIIILTTLLILPYAVAFAPTQYIQFARKIHLMAVPIKQTGKVKFFDTTKGFGFIVPTDGSPDIFVHQTAIHAKGFRSLAEGEEVEFDLQEDVNSGRRTAGNVTGPNGDFVQGAPYKMSQDGARRKI